jgi:hypothetical protein
MIMQTTDKLNEVLRLLSLESAKESDDDTAAAGLAYIMGQDSMVEMSAERRQRLVNQLADVATNLSFGSLLKAEMEQAQETAASLATKTRLPEVVISQLMTDSLYTNNVPIMMLKDLLLYLQISFDSAERAIRSTFRALKSRASDDLFAGSGGTLVAAYRKGSFLSKSSVPGTTQGDGKGLFENEQVMEKYLKRLKELIA